MIKNKKILYLVLISSILTVPNYAFGMVYDIASLGVALLRPVWIVFAIIAIICFVVAGVLFLTAQGDPEKIRKARSAVIWGSVGIIVGIFAFSATFVIGNLL